MQALGIILAAALPAAAAAILIIGAISLCYYRHSSKGKVKSDQAKTRQIDRSEGSVTKRFWSLGAGGGCGINRDPCESYYKQSNRIANEWRAAYPIKPFDWSEHPGLVAEAVEHGWASFAFTYSPQLIGSPLMQHRLWGFCSAGCSQAHLLEPETSWEVGAGSSDYVQKIRLNPGLSAAAKRQGETKPVQALQTALPLPGPPLGPLSFPEEGYFEITILADGADSNVDSSSQASFNENEHMKLINSASSSTEADHSVVKAGAHTSSEFKPRSSYYNGNEYTHNERRPSSYNAPNSENDLQLEGRANVEDINQHSGEVHAIVKVSTTCSIKQTSTGAASSLADINHAILSANSTVSDIHDLLRQSQICAIGLAAGSAPPFRLPGCDPGSIGFFSDGRVFINGVEDTHKAAITKNWRRKSWGGTNTTVGCGFDPTAGRLRFTLNGEVAEELTLADGGEGLAFARHPLFPTVAANYDVAMTANFGQAPFEWAPANRRRVADPCFGRAPPRPPDMDSGDLFSMPWLSDVGPASSPSPLPAPTRVPVPPPRQPEHATSPSQHFDSDLFEIVLDSSQSARVPHHYLTP